MRFKSTDFGKMTLFFLAMSLFNYGLTYPVSDCGMLTVSSWTDEADLKNQYAECRSDWNDLFWNTILGLGIFSAVIAFLMGLFRPKYDHCHEKSATELRN